MRRLLVLACSQRNRPNIEPLPALTRYDGPAFRIVQRYLAVTHDSAIHIRILSSRFGLIHPEHHIPAYDQKMTPNRADELADTVLTEVRNLLQTNAYEDALFFGGKLYRSTIQPAINREKIRATGGGLGHQLSQLRQWPYLGGPSQTTLPKPMAPGSHIRLHHRHLEMSPAEAHSRALDLIENGAAHRVKPTVWVARFETNELPVKWLMSQLSGLPVSEFTTSEALRVLAQLGIETGQEQ